MSRPEFRATYGEISVSYSVTSIGAQTRLRANACVSHLPGGTALAHLPLLGEDSSGPLGAGLLSSGVLAQTIREIQADLTAGR